MLHDLVIATRRGRIAVGTVVLAFFSNAPAVAQQPNSTSQAAQQQPPKNNSPAIPHADATASPRSDVSPSHVKRPFAPLSAKQQQRLNQILDYWQHTSSQIKTYSCRFTRFEYDHVFGPQDKTRHKTQAEGLLRYAAPDKGEYKIERVGIYVPPAKADESATYPMKVPEHAEHWICDGKSVYELNGQTKQLIVQSLPLEMQGKLIADGPLPFMFGASKQKILHRYWMREIPPPAQRQGEYWLEAWPKRREDAANFQRVMIILDEQRFLPHAMQIFPPSYDQRGNTSREVYTFVDLKVNDPIHRGRDFMGGFISPRKPLGWKKVVTNYGQVSPAATAAQPPTGGAQSANQR